MLTFANSNQFGFNAQIAPTASLNDGLIDLCIMKKPPIITALFFLPLLFLGQLHKTPFLEVIKTREVKVIQRKNYITHTDGDHLELSKELIVKVLPLSLRVIVP
jgi:diacylglycerol kinase family enzyme